MRQNLTNTGRFEPPNRAIEFVAAVFRPPAVDVAFDFAVAVGVLFVAAGPAKRVRAAVAAGLPLPLTLLS